MSRTLDDDLESLRGTTCAVLILGETGTGKSVLARQIHARSVRSAGPLVEVNCAGLGNELVQSELFGHARGSFTGAHEARAGLLEAAHTGTLFLDEIGDMDLRVQPKILKVLEEKQFRRMGELRERSVDIRLVAATHANLLGLVARKAFRQDLYYRVSTLTIVLPPLRERADEIQRFASAMLAALPLGGGVTLAPEALRKLEGHTWPGNLRELKNVLERAVVRRRHGTLDAADIEFDAYQSSNIPEPPPAGAHGSSAREGLLSAQAGAASRREVEREHIRLALVAERGCIRSTARKLGIARSTLYTKLRVHGLLAS